VIEVRDLIYTSKLEAILFTIDKYTKQKEIHQLRIGVHPRFKESTNLIKEIIKRHLIGQQYDKSTVETENWWTAGLMKL
jgi:predicted secreted protein